MAEATSAVRAVVLVRGVNVGGNRRLAMPDLRALLVTLGWSDVATLGQSGNAVGIAPIGEPAWLEDAVRAGLGSNLGLDVAVMVRSGAELDAALAACPYARAAVDPATLHFAFLVAPLPTGALTGLPAGRYGTDEIAAGDRVLYLRLPGGAGRSKLAVEFERRLGVVATARNLNTVTRLAAMARPGG